MTLQSTTTKILAVHSDFLQTLLKRKNQPVVNRLKCKAWKTQLDKTSQVKEEEKKAATLYSR